MSDIVDAVFATPDLGAGSERVAFVLSDDTGLIRFPVVNIRSFRYGSTWDGVGPRPARQGPVESVSARFYEFPLGTRGIHVATLSFPEAGNWSIEIDVPRPDGTVSVAEVLFPVAMKSDSIAVGQTPPASRSRTIRDVPSIGYLTTGSHRDADLYQTSVADALQSGRPAVVVFASPAFCTNAVCGPQVEVLSDVKDLFKGQADFIHIDYYENPQEIQGDLNLAVPSPVLKEWGLESQEWTYVIGADGRVAARFENFAPFPEVEAALRSAIAAASTPKS